MLGTPNHGSFAIPQVITGLEGMVRKLAVVDLATKAVVRTIDLGEFRRIAGFRRSELLLALSTLAAVLVLGAGGAARAVCERGRALRGIPRPPSCKPEWGTTAEGGYRTCVGHKPIDRGA